jgi:predicted RNA-binding Zn-ribbon protein involved in translation (DUF1610 family)
MNGEKGRVSPEPDVLAVGCVSERWKACPRCGHAFVFHRRKRVRWLRGARVCWLCGWCEAVWRRALTGGGP